MNFRIAALCLILGSALVRADDVKSILERMNAAAPAFHGATADVTMDTYESILDSHTIEHGTLQMQRKSSKDVRAILDFKGEASARTLFFQGKKLIIYYPKTDYYQEFDLGTKSQLLNQYLLLGFGSSGNDLAASYDITDGGQPETVAGETTTKLVLIPKDESVKKNLSKIEIWIPSDGANPVQQKFYQTNGDYRMVTYTNLKINPPMAGTLQFQLPKSAQKRS